MRAAYAAALTGTLAIFASVSAARGQDIAQRIRQIDNGTVQLVFASKPGVCGDGATFISTNGVDDEGNRTTFRQSGSGININHGYSDYSSRNCDEGPVRVALDVRNGQVVDLDTYVGRLVPGGALVVSPRAAVPYLLDLAEHASSSVGKHAILPALLADSIEPWPQLLRIARNENVNRDVRKSSIFWLGIAAGDKSTAGLKSLLSDDDVEIRKQVVFALSQLKGEAGLNSLIEIAKTSKDPAVRKSALFWLSQKNDPRVLALFEDILLK